MSPHPTCLVEEKLMLGEVHSLNNDFPELEAIIAQLLETDHLFAADNKQYTALDKEIRTLELRGGPIDDMAMHQLKHDRAELKDSLYRRMVAAQA
ncbi:YdcH family protein [Halioglobus sp. HI00S01]|uniref:YdcH family protein n=1 Tax=Halioglobus sp. HI00S01 TaxID=1822214 RepID=UPI0018D4B87A|nr:YdcH family protein [Halioglobus sp. HI00S01]